MIGYLLAWVAGAVCGFFGACWICSTHLKEHEKEEAAAARIRRDYQ